MSAEVYLAIGVASLIPLVFLWGVRLLDLYATGKFFFNITTLLWGVVAFVLAARINPAMREAGWVTRDQMIRITAPIVEEFLKALILIYLVQRADFNYIVDGAIYGFGAGIGFAIIENIGYIHSYAGIALTVALTRVFSTNLVHATGSGLIGSVLAYRRGNPSWRGWLFTILGYAFSMMFHMVFNTMVSVGTYLFVAVVYGGMGLGLIWYAIRSGMNTQKHWVIEKLGEVDRVTQSEVKAVTQIEALQREVLAPVEERFGPEKVAQVRSMLQLQAELGIKRKLLEATPSESKRHEIEKIIQDLGQKMDVLRNQIGFYCMMFVREVYLSQEVKVWDAINTRVSESSTGQKGGGLWDRATDRVKASKSQEGKS